jgi:hypothetical protein
MADVDRDAQKSVEGFKTHTKSHEGQGHKCAPAAPIEHENMMRCTLHEQKRILGFLFEHCIGKHIHSTTTGAEVYRLMTEDYGIDIPKGKCAKKSTKATVNDYRQPPTLSGREDEKLLLHFMDLVLYVAPVGIGSNDDFHLLVRLALAGFAQWQDAVHTRVEGAWPAAAALKGKMVDVQEKAEVMFNTVSAACKKSIPYMHDALHNTAYGRKDAHSRNAEGQEHKGKENKLKGREITNGKAKDTSTTIMVAVAAEEYLQETTPQPLSRHCSRVAKHGHTCERVELDPKANLQYGKCPRTDGPPA